MCDFFNQMIGHKVFPDLPQGVTDARDKLFNTLRGNGGNAAGLDFLQHGTWPGGQSPGMPQAPGAAPNPMKSLFPQFGGNPQTPQAAQSPSIPLGVGKGPFG